MPLTPVNTFDDFLSGYSLALRANEEDEARRARRRAEMLQDEERQEAKDRRAASQRLNSALYDRTVLMPEVLDAGDGRDFGATVDALSGLVNESKLFAAADPVDQRAILGPAIENDRKLRSMQQASWLKQQFEREKQQEQIKAVLGLGLPPEMQDRVIGRIVTGQPIPFEDNDTYSMEEWTGSSARQLLSPEVQQVADAYVRSTGRFPPSSFFKNVLDPKSPLVSLNASKNPHIARALTQVKLAEATARQAQAHYNRVWWMFREESYMNGQPSPETIRALEEAKKGIADAEAMHRDAFLNLQNVQTEQAALMPGMNPAGGPASTQPVPIQQPAAPTPAAAQPSAALQPSDVPQSVPYLSAMAPAPPAAPQPPAAPAATPGPVPDNADDITRKIAEAFAAERSVIPSGAAPAVSAPSATAPGTEARPSAAQTGGYDREAARALIPKVNEEFQRRYGRPPTGTDREAWTAIMREMLGGDGQ